MTLYPFSQGDRLTERNTYAYIPFAGESFLTAWEESRGALLAILPPAMALPSPVPPVEAVTPPCQAAPLLEYLLARITTGTLDGESRGCLRQILKRFEVSKRIHLAYQADFKPMDAQAFRDLSLYLRAADLFAAAHAHGEGMPFLNALLKIMDTLVSSCQELDAPGQARLAALILLEKEYVARLAQTLGVHW